jgi:hypothetical protein
MSQPRSPAPILAAAQAEPLPELSQICDNYCHAQDPGSTEMAPTPSLVPPALHRPAHHDQSGGRWFAELTARKLCRSAHCNVIELETESRKWIDE